MGRSIRRFKKKMALERRLTAIIKAERATNKTEETSTEPLVDPPQGCILCGEKGPRSMRGYCNSCDDVKWDAEVEAAELTEDSFEQVSEGGK